jgi:hypothetical protein
LIVDPRNAADEPEYDDEWIIILTDAALGYTINGKSFPVTHPKTLRRASDSSPRKTPSPSSTCTITVDSLSWGATCCPFRRQKATTRAFSSS